MRAPFKLLPYINPLTPSYLVNTQTTSCIADANDQAVIFLNVGLKLKAVKIPWALGFVLLDAHFQA